MKTYNSFLKSTNEFHVYLRAYALFWALSLSHVFAFSQYLNGDSVARLISFQANDYPGNVASECLPKPIGIHYFGDFVSAVCHARLPSPYISEFATNYFPFSYIVMRPYAWLGNIDFRLALFAFVLTSVMLILAPIYRKIQNDSEVEAASFVIFAIALSHPFISMLDRGNIQFLVTGLVVIGLIQVEKKTLVSPIFIGLATAMKIYPVIYMAVFVRRREWLRLVVAIFTSLVSSIASLLLFAGSFTDNFQQMIKKVLVFQSVTDTHLRYNSSLKALFISFDALDIQWVSSLAKYGLQNYTLVSLVAAFSICLVIVFFRIDMFNFGILAAIFCALFLDLSAPYVMTLFFVAVMNLQCSSQISMRRRVVIICLAILMVPKGLIFGGADVDTRASLLTFINPSLMIFMLTTILADRNAWPSRRRIQSN